MKTANLEMLIPGFTPEVKTKVQHPEARFRKATVTALNPLAIQLDGDDAALIDPPDQLIGTQISRTSQRVLVLMLGGQVIVVDVIDDGAVVGPVAPVGAVHLWSGNPAAAPSKYMFAAGASLVQSDYPDLYSVIGTNYGSADSTHFNLPTVPNSGGLPYIIRVLP